MRAREKTCTAEAGGLSSQTNGVASNCNGEEGRRLGGHSRSSVLDSSRLRHVCHLSRDIK